MLKQQQRNQIKSKQNKTKYSNTSHTHQCHTRINNNYIALKYCINTQVVHLRSFIVMNTHKNTINHTLFSFYKIMKCHFIRNDVIKITITKADVDRIILYSISVALALHSIVFPINCLLYFCHFNSILNEYNVQYFLCHTHFLLKFCLLVLHIFDKY